MPKVSLSKTLFLTAGAAVGALLLAPKSGKELRQDIKREAKRLSGEAKVYAGNLKDDFEDAYEEAKEQAQYEKEVVARQEAELAQTIAEIEHELEAREAESHANRPVASNEGDLDNVPDNVLEEVDLGDVKDTTQEPEQDQVVPSDRLDEALEDQNLEDDSDFQVNPQ